MSSGVVQLALEGIGWRNMKDRIKLKGKARLGCIDYLMFVISDAAYVN